MIGLDEVLAWWKVYKSISKDRRRTKNLSSLFLDFFFWTLLWAFLTFPSWGNGWDFKWFAKVPPKSIAFYLRSSEIPEKNFIHNSTWLETTNIFTSQEQCSGSPRHDDVLFLFNNRIQKVRIFLTWGSVENVRDKKVGLNV